jgi:protein gp37
MHPTWARELRDQCKAACVPFFFKQASAVGHAARESFPDLTAARAWPAGYMEAVCRG